jgi:hypothetical protein
VLSQCDCGYLFNSPADRQPPRRYDRKSISQWRLIACKLDIFVLGVTGLAWAWVLMVRRMTHEDFAILPILQIGTAAGIYDRRHPFGDRLEQVVSSTSTRVCDHFPSSGLY